MPGFRVVTDWELLVSRSREFNSPAHPKSRLNYERLIIGLFTGLSQFFLLLFPELKVLFVNFENTEFTTRVATLFRVWILWLEFDLANVLCSFTKSL
jgi:hypothetical protein